MARASTTKHIAITGGSSGLGAALARHYAASGEGIHLSLSGRNLERLEAVASECHDLGAATVNIAIVDVTDKDAVHAWLAGVHDTCPLDIVIANAGISGGTEGNHASAQRQAQVIFDTNVRGVMNTVYPAVSLMTKRGGQIAIVSSLAGWRGFAGAPAYCASKAAVKVWGEALRGLYKPSGIYVTVICPGFVRTPMTDINPYYMPFLMPAEKAAQRIAKGLKTRRSRIAFPLPMVFLVWLATCLPDRLAQRLTAYFPEKPPLCGMKDRE